MYEKLLILKRSILPTENPLEKQVCPRPGVMNGRMQPILEDVGDNFGRVPCPDGLLWGSGFDIIATCVLRCLTIPSPCPNKKREFFKSSANGFGERH